MSIKLMTHVWDHGQHSGTELLMLLALADHANDDGICWPSIARLAARCRIQPRQAINVLHKLEQAGDITVQRGGGRGMVSHYCVKGAAHCTVSKPSPVKVPPGPAALPPESSTENTVLANTVISPENRVMPCAKGVIALAHEPPKDPPREAKKEPSVIATPHKRENGFTSQSRPLPSRANSAPLDETSSWLKPPVAWSAARPDALLGAADLPPDAYATLYAQADAELKAEGVHDNWRKRPAVEARMTLMLERQPLMPVVPGGCGHEHLDANDICNVCGEIPDTASILAP
jgi:Helix-turn-helix domain